MMAITHSISVRVTPLRRSRVCSKTDTALVMHVQTMPGFKAHSGNFSVSVSAPNEKGQAPRICGINQPSISRAKLPRS